MRRIKGIWPPSNPVIPPQPERERWPFMPRVDWAPWPLPIPRPTIFGRCLDPGEGFNSSIRIADHRLLAASDGADLLLGAEIFQRFQRGIHHVVGIRSPQ